MENQVIKVLNEEHGKKVIKYWRSKGVETRAHKGIITEEERGKYIYYGVIDGTFSNYSINKVIESNAEIITLPDEINTNGFEYFGDKLMEVSGDEVIWHKRVVFGKKLGLFYAWELCDSFDKATQMKSIMGWKYAREIINEEKVVSMQEIADLLGVNVEKLKIKK